jgi:hypothetical protein
MSPGHNREAVTETSVRERWLWLFVFSIPPGIGMAGFVAVALKRGGLSPTAIAVGTATTAVVGTVFYVTAIRNRGGAPGPDRADG